MLVSRLSFLHTGRVTFAGKSSPLYKLRQKTGLAYNLCREALEKHQNNLDEAEGWLKAQALAHGLQKATKVGSRATKEGLIGIAVHRDNKMATLVELNCETDFVAKNQMFRDFLTELTERVSTDNEDCTRFDIPGQSNIEGFKPSDGALSNIRNDIVPLITKLGENIRIGRALHFKVYEDPCLNIYGQVHAQASRRETSQLNIATGRYAAMVGLRHSSSSERLSTVGNRLCRHVLGYNPTYIELPESLRKHLEEAEREAIKEKQDETINDEVEADESSHNTRDEWPSMMDQTLIMSEDITVRDFCTREGVSIIYFNRFECSEM